MSTVERQIEHRLADRGMRYTTGRRVVTQALIGADGPRSVAELASAVASRVPLSSLYRTLAVLEESGVAEPHFGPDGVGRYELAEWLRGHHHHLLCSTCGSVEDVEVADGLEGEVGRLVEQIGARSGFTPTGHTLEIEGRCGRCA